jgi:SAM-dependent methyltransferase
MIAQPLPEKTLLKLDLGCGTRKQEGFIGVDSMSFKGVDMHCDLAKTPWVLTPWATRSDTGETYAVPGADPLPNESVAEVFCCHFIEHLDAQERINFVNELWRVLVPGGKAVIIVPYWASARAYGDLTHKWPPVSEFWFGYLSKAWREANAPHNDFYKCNFTVTGDWTMHPALTARNDEFKSFAIQFYKEAAQDMRALFVKEPM